MKREPKIKKMPPCFTPKQWDYYVAGCTAADHGQKAVGCIPVCGDCTDKYQRQMIREHRCINPCKVLPGNPLHRWHPHEQVPERVGV